MFNRNVQMPIGIGAAVAALAIAAPFAAADPAPVVIPQQSAAGYWKSFLEVHADLPDGRAGLHRTPPGVGGGAR